MTDQKVSLSRIFKQKLLKKNDIDITEFNVTEAIHHEVQTLAQEGLKEKDLVESLPGQPSKARFKQYAGYVTVDQKAGRAFFYYFVEAQHSPDKSPLLLWLNGGSWTWMFFFRFPEYKDREFYIAGESYAGHYVPQLAQTIMHHNKRPNNTIIHLKGVIIGNAVIDDEADTIGQWEYVGSHALISDVTTSKALKYCNFSHLATTQPRECEEAVEESGKEIGNIDFYNIYAPLCTKPSLTKKIS
ncbi:serine carboxypeptidase, partial [Striga asiatica]